MTAVEGKSYGSPKFSSALHISEAARGLPLCKPSGAVPAVQKSQAHIHTYPESARRNGWYGEQEQQTRANGVCELRRRGVYARGPNGYSCFFHIKKRLAGPFNHLSLCHAITGIACQHTKATFFRLRDLSEMSPHIGWATAWTRVIVPSIMPICEGAVRP